MNFKAIETTGKIVSLAGTIVAAIAGIFLATAKPANENSDAKILKDLEKEYKKK